MKVCRTPPVNWFIYTEKKNSFDFNIKHILKNYMREDIVLLIFINILIKNNFH